MDAQEPQNCWEYFNCSEEEKKKCPAFPANGRKCWEVAASFKGEVYCQTQSSGMMFCLRECGWYKKVQAEKK